MKTFKSISVIGGTAVLFLSLSACKGQKVFDDVAVQDSDTVRPSATPTEVVAKEEATGDAQGEIVNPAQDEPKAEEKKDEPSGSDSDDDSFIALKPGNNFTKVLGDYQPHVVQSFPKADEENAATDGDLAVQLDVGFDKDSLSSRLKLKVFGVLGWFDVPYTLYETINSDKFAFKPNGPLKAGAAYAIVIEKGLRTEKGISTDDIVIPFETKIPGVFRFLSN